jgi:hypothetical protein
MYVTGRWFLFILSSMLFFFSCGKSDGNAPTQFSSSDPAPTVPGSGNIYGTITDSLTGLAIANAAITVYSSGTAVSSTTTDSNGQYSFGNFDNGTYNMSFVATNYVSITNFSLGIAGAARNINKSMTPPTLSGELRIVLTWKSDDPDVPNIARDIDSYFLNSSENTSVDYTETNMSWTDGSSATLDHDSTNYSGPETITVSNISNSSVYHYYIHNYSHFSDCASLGLSGVHVDVYSGSSIIKSYDLLNGSVGDPVYEFFKIQNGQIVDTGVYDSTLLTADGPEMSVCTP